jgi:hypothetical protein
MQFGTPKRSVLASSGSGCPNDGNNEITCGNSYYTLYHITAWADLRHLQHHE